MKTAVRFLVIAVAALLLGLPCVAIASHDSVSLTTAGTVLYTAYTLLAFVALAAFAVFLGLTARVVWRWTRS